MKKSEPFADNDFRHLLDSLPSDRKLTAAQCRRASVNAMEFGHDNADRKMILQMLGLMPS